VQVDPRKVAAITERPEPKNVSDVRSFLGLVGYYRKFLASFGEISAPLVELTKKDQRWAWYASHRHAFAALKEMLTTAPTLLIPNTTKGDSFVIHVDASDYAVGAVLLQDQGSGLQPCAYFSKKPDSAQRNYSVGDKEMLAIKLALMEFKIYVEGLPTVLCTDHRNNVDLLTRPVDKVASKRIARVIEFMQQFIPNLKLAYIQGEDNLADAPSRRPDYLSDAEDSKAIDAQLARPHPLSAFLHGDRLNGNVRQVQQAPPVSRLNHLPLVQDPGHPRYLALSQILPPRGSLPLGEPPTPLSLREA
jgi:hypothetical protein